MVVAIGRLLGVDWDVTDGATAPLLFLDAYVAPGWELRMAMVMKRQAEERKKSELQF